MRLAQSLSVVQRGSELAPLPRAARGLSAVQWVPGGPSFGLPDDPLDQNSMEAGGALDALKALHTRSINSWTASSSFEKSTCVVSTSMSGASS